MADPAETIFLDACVLFPALVREALLAAAGIGAFRPAWSPRVLAEWRIAALRQGQDDTALEAATASIAARFPDALTMSDPDLEAQIDLPDPADAHVLAGAVAAGAKTLLTFNLRDFPVRRLARFQIAPRHPDSLLWEVHSHAPWDFGERLDALLLAAGAADRKAGRKLLKRALLPRLGKAWAADCGDA